MASIQLQTGVQTVADGASTTARGGKTGELNTSDAHARYQEAVYRGNVYSLSISAATPTAYVGAAGGTPLLSAHNPTGSGKNLVLLGASLGLNASASAAGAVLGNIWVGPSATPTGTAATPVNNLTWAASGSVARGGSNTALTSSTALTNVFPLLSYYWATAASAAITGTSWFDIAGVIIASPGTQFNLGVTAALTSATWSASLFWEEILV